MFDDNNPRNSAPPLNLPVKNEPTDMFGDLDEAKNEAPNALEAGMLKKKENFGAEDKKAYTQDGEEKSYVVKEPILGKVILIVMIGVLLAGIAIGSFWIYDNFLVNKSQVIIVDETQQTKDNVVVEEIKPVATTTAITPNVQETSTDAVIDMQVDEVLFGEPIDTDKDGLDDIREKELGTNPKVSDTDKDGLIDGDEVIIWKTNPLNPDTDGDGYADGEEVKNGYNPLGSGKIFTAEEENSTNTPK